MFCKNCGNEVPEGSSVCPNCGSPIEAAQPQQTYNAPQNGGYNAPQNGGYNAQPQPKSKLVAGLLGIFLGAWGVHNFYLGNTSRAVIQIVVTLITCGIGSLWGFIEGILILTGNINTDANGNPLAD